MAVPLNSLSAKELLALWASDDPRSKTAGLRLTELVIRVQMVADERMEKTVTGRRARELVKKLSFKVAYDKEVPEGAKCQISRKKAVWRAREGDEEYYLSEEWYWYARDYMLSRMVPHMREHLNDAGRFGPRLTAMVQRLLVPPVANAKYDDEFSVAPMLLAKFTD